MLLRAGRGGAGGERVAAVRRGGTGCCMRRETAEVLRSPFLRGEEICTGYARTLAQPLPRFSCEPSQLPEHFVCTGFVERPECNGKLLLCIPPGKSLPRWWGTFALLV